MSTLLFNRGDLGGTPCRNFSNWNFSGLLRDASDMQRFPTVHMVETHFLSISEPSLGILEKFQCSSALPNIKI